jgi:hypothetical protein
MFLRGRNARIGARGETTYFRSSLPSYVQHADSWLATRKKTLLIRGLLNILQRPCGSVFGGAAGAGLAKSAVVSCSTRSAKYSNIFLRYQVLRKTTHLRRYWSSFEIVKLLQAPLYNASGNKEDHGREYHNHHNPVALQSMSSRGIRSPRSR